MANETLVSLFTNIASAIRTKTGSSDTIVATNFPSAILDIPTGGGDKLKLFTPSMSYSANTDILSWDAANSGDFGKYAVVLVNNISVETYTYSAPYTGSYNLTTRINNTTNFRYDGLVVGSNPITGFINCDSTIRGLLDHSDVVSIGTYNFLGYKIDNNGTLTLIASSLQTTNIINPWTPGYEDNNVLTDVGYIMKFTVEGGN